MSNIIPFPGSKQYPALGCGECLSADFNLALTEDGLIAVCYDCSTVVQLPKCICQNDSEKE